MTRDILKIINLVSSICMCLYSPGRGIQDALLLRNHSKKALSNSILLPLKEGNQEAPSQI